jgi:hypothetical protein
MDDEPHSGIADDHAHPLLLAIDLGVRPDTLRQIVSGIRPADRFRADSA